MIEKREELPPAVLPVVTRGTPDSPEQQGAALHNQRDVGAIVAHVWENAEKLVRQELELGLAELDRRVDKLKVGLTTAAIGGAVLYAGILVLLAAAVLGLSNVMAPWLAALIVGGIVTAVGATLGQRGSHKAAESAKPDEHLDRTVRAMKEAIK